MCSARSASPTTRSAVVGALAALGLAELRQQQRQLHVLARGEHRDQVEELEDEADVLGAEARELVLGQLVQQPARDRDAALGRPVEAREQVQERRLARARRPHQRHEAAALDRERDVLERVHLVGAAPIDPGDVLELDQAGTPRRRSPSVSASEDFAQRLRHAPPRGAERGHDAGN